jgi:hypothetical protein
VARDFLFSAELRSNLIDTYYEVLLHRASDAGKFGWFSSNLDANGIRLGFDSSVEFFTTG